MALHGVADHGQDQPHRVAQRRPVAGLRAGGRAGRRRRRRRARLAGRGAALVRALRRGTGRGGTLRRGGWAVLGRAGAKCRAVLRRARRRLTCWCCCGCLTHLRVRTRSPARLEARPPARRSVSVSKEGPYCQPCASVAGPRTMRQPRSPSRSASGRSASASGWPAASLQLGRSLATMMLRGSSLCAGRQGPQGAWGGERREMATAGEGGLLGRRGRA